MKNISSKLMVFFIVIVLLVSAGGTLRAANFTDLLLNNQYLLESIRLTQLAEECYAQGEYDDAIRYAEEALKYAYLSNAYVSLQYTIKQTDDAIAAAKNRLDWVGEIGAAERYADAYQEAQSIFGVATAERDAEHWDPARRAALQVLDILSVVIDIPAYPSQYLVRTWELVRDCLWNIAGKQQIYGDPYKWPILYAANREKLENPANPDLIHPGMILDIPSISGEVRRGLWDEAAELASRGTSR
jgi:tetratricopeptide (TPR) repeat protein